MSLGRAGRRSLLAGSRCYCQGNKEGRLEGTTRRRVPLSQREGEWRSKLGVFAPETPRSSVLRLVQVPLDWSPGSVGRWWRRKKGDLQVLDQRYVPERHQILGSNLATAHFVVARGGAVRFCGSEEWVRKKEGEDEYGLPHTYVPGMLLEAVDASGMGLCYEGLDNFVNLQHLRWLGLAGSSHVDDWFLDRISSQFQDTVQHLDISDCANVTERGLCALYRMSALRTLKVRGPATLCQEFQLACLMLEEIHCGLHVEGVTYLSLPDDPDGRGQP